MVFFLIFLGDLIKFKLEEMVNLYVVVLKKDNVNLNCSICVLRIESCDNNLCLIYKICKYLLMIFLKKWIYNL